MNSLNETSKLFTDDGLNFIALFKLFFAKKKFIIRLTILFFLLGLFIALFSKNEFTSNTVIIPQTSGTSSKGLSGLARLAGLNLNNSDNSSEISPLIYPKIFNSVSFRKKLMTTSLNIEGFSNVISFKDYYLSYFEPGVLATFKKYTIGLPGVIISSFSNSKENRKIVVSSEDSIVSISDTDRILIDKLATQTSIEINKDDGYITIKSTMPEPKAAAQLTSNAKLLLQEAIISLQIQKSQLQLDYLENRLNETKAEFIKSQIALANFKDRNLFSSTARSNTKLKKLESDYNLTFGVYSELAQQVESQRLQVKRDTPVFTVIQEPVIPDKKSGPSKFGILFLYTFFGFIVALLWIFLKVYLIHIRYNNKFN